MSWGTCYSGSNNIYFDFPPIMDDGRNYATYLPMSIINNKIRLEQGLTSNYNYRQYLMQNATNLINTNKLVACDNCGPCLGQFNNQPLFSTNKYLYYSLKDRSIPYGYETSDLKQLYLSREELNNKLT